MKKLISGLFKKPEGNPANVPEELPPIAGEKDSSQEQAQSPSQAAQPKEAKNQEPQPEVQNEEVPAELPELEEAEAPAPVAEPQPEAESKYEYPQPSSTNAEQHAPEPQPAHEGFFSKLAHLIKSEKGYEKVMKQSLVSTMKETYDVRKESSKTGLTSIDENRLKQGIEEAMGMLKLLEGRWRAQKLVIDEDEKALREYEQSLKENEIKLKKLLKQYSIYEAPEKPLVLKNCLEVRNISGLYNTLRVIDDRAYSMHISKSKNDFSDFVKGIDPVLAEKIRKARSRNGVLRILEAFIKSRMDG